MPVDIDKIFSRGGKGLINLLDYAVRAVQPDLIFIFLVGEYRDHPTTPKAVALYDVFCAPHALARLSVVEMLPPTHHQLEVALRPLRLNLSQVQAARASGAVAPPWILPPRFLFDAVAMLLREKSRALRQIKRSYRSRRTAFENLPGGRMSERQRHFVERVWEPNLRPWLVAAGFRRVGCIA